MLEDDYKTAIVADLTGTFQVYRVGSQEPVYTGQLQFLGRDTITSEDLYIASFSVVAFPGKYYIKVGGETSYNFEILEDLYNKVLYYTLRVYGANRCGPYSSWIHQPCHLKDGLIRGSGKEGSLAGGWHDCGDHVKFGHTIFYAACALLFAYNNWPEKFADVYGSEYDGNYYNPSPDGIPDVLNEVKVVTDYLLNLYNASKEDGLLQQNRLYYQVGDGDDDHTWWHKPEYQDDFPQSKGGQPREVWSDIGADLAGRFAAALAMMATAYYKFDPEYASKCLNAAKDVYAIGKAVYGMTGRNSGGKGYYSPDTRADDDMALAALQLYKATQDNYYLQETQYWMYKEQKWQFCSYYVLSYPNVFAFVLYDYYPYASTVDNRPDEIDTKIVTKDECIEWLKRDVLQSAPSADIYGRKWDYGWGTCRYMMGVAATAVLAYDLTLKTGNPDKEMLKIAKDQMNWIFGRNQFGLSFVIGNSADGWLTKYPQHPHHRAANPDGKNVPELPPYPATELTGATIGGPKSHTDFSDRWDDYVATETGVDYWAGTVITAAYFAKPVSIDTKPTLLIQSLKDGSTIYGEVDIVVNAYDDKGISKIEFYINDQKVYSVDSSTSLVYKFNSSSYNNGVYNFKFIAYDTISQKTEKEIKVFINNSLYPIYITIAPQNAGSVSKQPDKQYYSINETVTLSAHPNAGYKFLNWTGDIQNSSNPITIVIMSTMNIIANFTSTSQQQEDYPPKIYTNLIENQILSGNVNLYIKVEDDFGITWISIFKNNNKIIEISTSGLVSEINYEFNTNLEPNGPCEIKIEAKDSRSQLATKLVYVTINNVSGNQAPVVYLNLSAGDLITTPFEVIPTIFNDDGILKVEYYFDNSLVWTSTFSPYTFLIDPSLYLHKEYDFKVLVYDEVLQVGFINIPIKISHQSFTQELAKIYLLTLNKDGLNDVIEFNANDIQKIEIFHPNGKLVKEIKGPFIWDGKNKDNTYVKSGVYIYRCKFKDGNIKVGVINVIK